MTIFDRAEQWIDDKLILIKNNMNKIVINGESFQVQGRNITINGEKICVDGELVKDGLKETVKIEFQGDLANLHCTAAVINGNVNGDVDGTTINVTGNVGGDVDGTTINCGDVGGDVDGTTITCGKIKGDVDAITVKKIKNNKI